MIMMITGSRSVENDALVLKILTAAIEKLGQTPRLIIHGGARGADLCVNRIAELLHIETAVRRPKYDEFKGREKAAPKARNSDMVAECDFLTGIWENESNGTADALEKIIKAQKPFVVYEVSRNSFVELTLTEIYGKLLNVRRRQNERKKLARGK